MKRLLLSSALLLGAAGTADATWSIVLVDHATGEVAIASATCLVSFPLEANVPAIVVGKGALAAQSTIDTGGTNRMIGFDLLLDGATPDQVLDALLTVGTNPSMRQYGVAAFAGPAATFSGAGAGDGVGNLVGAVGSITYAIQGNLLVGPEPVFAAEEALIGTDGDIGQRMMAAMQAAKAMGGDGRCSCAGGDPTGCGAPPPSFTKSAHCGFVYVARIGDADGTCDAGGCATGSYHLALAYSGSASDPDPVYVLQGQYDAWRAGLAGRPDGVLSTVDLGADRLPADGITSTSVTVGLVDVDGAPLTVGGATLAVSTSADSTADVSLGPVVDNGDGSYTFEVVAGVVSGVADLVVAADDGVVEATLFPFPRVTVDPAQPLHVGASTVDPFQDASVALTFQEPAAAGGQVLILASTSGTVPGTPVAGLTLPLNVDDAFWFTFQTANTGPLVNTFATVDATGRAEARFEPAAGFLASVAGLRVDWAALYLSGSGLGVTNADGFTVALGP